VQRKLNCRLKEILLEHGRDQRDLAGAIGVSRTSVTLYANEKAEPKISVALRIAEELGVSVEEIWCLQDSH